MSGKIITLEVDDAAQELLIRNYHALVMALNDPALTAPETAVLDHLEALAIERGRPTLQASLQPAVPKRIDEAEKKGRPSAPALAARNAKIEARASGNGSVTWGR
jgi:hypothetical protein